MDNQIPKKAKSRAITDFLNQRSSKFLKETIERAYTTANVKKFSQRYSLKREVLYLDQK